MFGPLGHVRPLGPSHRVVRVCDLVKQVVFVEGEGAAEQDVQHDPEAPHVCRGPVATRVRHR